MTSAAREPAAAGSAGRVVIVVMGVGGVRVGVVRRVAACAGACA